MGTAAFDLAGTCVTINLGTKFRRSISLWVDRILRVREVVETCGISRPHIYAEMSKGRFPKSVKVGLRAVGWRESEVQKWIKTRGREA